MFVRKIRRWEIAGLILLMVFGLASFALPAVKVVNIWHTEASEEAIQVVSKIIADFEKQNPGVKVEQQGLYFDDMWPKLMSSLAIGSPPDLAQAEPYSLAGLQAKGVLRPMDDLIEHIGEENIFPVVKKLTYIKGHWYGIPHAHGSQMLQYRKDWFREKGLRPAETWDEWYETMVALREDVNGDGIFDRWGLIDRGDKAGITQNVPYRVASNGGRIYDDEGNPVFTEQAMIETLEFYKKRNEYMPPDWLSATYPDCMIRLATGKVGQFPGWGRGVHWIEKYAPPEIADTEHFGAAAFPRGPHGKVGIAGYDGEPWISFKDSKCPELAIEFLKCFYKPENYVLYCSAYPTASGPVIRTIVERPEFWENPFIKKWKEFVEIQYKVIRGESSTFGVSRWEEIKFPWISDIAAANVLADAVIDVLVEGKTPEEAAARAQKKAEEIIETGYKR